MARQQVADLAAARARGNYAQIWALCLQLRASQPETEAGQEAAVWLATPRADPQAVWGGAWAPWPLNLVAWAWVLM